jgi:hypothetical protein
MISRAARQLLSAALVAVVACSAARGDTTVPITGIGTKIDTIDTRVEQVTYAGPVAKVPVSCVTSRVTCPVLRDRPSGPDRCFHRPMPIPLLRPLPGASGGGERILTANTIFL